MRNSILVQGWKNLSLMEGCSKTYRTTYDEIFTVDLLGWITFRAKIFKKSVRQILSYFLLHILLICKNSVLQIFVFPCTNVKLYPFSYSWNFGSKRVSPQQINWKFHHRLYGRLSSNPRSKTGFYNLGRELNCTCPLFKRALIWRHVSRARKQE